MHSVWSDPASGSTDAAAAPRSWHSPAELSLDDRERFYRALVEQARDLITVIDEQGVILFKNRSTEHSLGYSPSDLIGRSVFEFIHPDDLAPVRAAFAAAMRGEPGGPVEHRFRYKDGSWRVFESVGCYRRDLPVGPIGIVNSHDITDRKSLEAQFRRAQRLEVIARTTSDVAHDFRNLLMTIVASADRMLAGEPTPVVRESATQLAEAAQRAETWTHRLLLFARDEASSMTQVVSVNQVVIELTALFHQLLGTTAGLTLNLGATPSWVAMDQVLLEQVLVNLVVNARDAMPSGGVVTIVTSNDAEQVAIEVRDTGIGMTDEVRTRIFEPFFTTKVERKGSGLGLSTVAGVVHQAGGRVEVVTQYRRGTTFRVTLPGRLWMPNDEA